MSTSRRRKKVDTQADKLIMILSIVKTSLNDVQVILTTTISIFTKMVQAMENCREDVEAEEQRPHGGRLTRRGIRGRVRP